MSDNPAREQPAPAQLDRIEAFLTDEVAAAALYRELAELDGDRRELFLELVATEERHADHWRQVLRDAGRDPQPGRRPWRSRLIGRLARWVGVDRVLPAVVRAEAADRDHYRVVPEAAPGMADEEADHGRTLALAATDSVGAGLAMADARHRTAAGGSLRAAVFGVNDGLVSNFALIMGMAGGTGQADVVLLAGVAGLVAGAGSMAAGEWVSVRSQRELYEHELAVEAWELEQFPDDERHELELIYRAKGLADDQAATVADAIMANPAVALDTLAREELGLDPSELGSAWTAAISSFLAFAVGAIVPLVPFLVAAGRGAVIASALASGIALAGVGAAISLFTGRSTWRSALRMVLIGGGAALATYLIGSLIGVAM
ncbi:MAG: VIT1/CCC1 transporter family protein [Nitriliruptoraceae bacterium]